MDCRAASANDCLLVVVDKKLGKKAVTSDANGQQIEATSSSCRETQAIFMATVVFVVAVLLEERERRERERERERGKVRNEKSSDSVVVGVALL